MIQIPQKLQNEHIKFVLLGKGDKKPYQEQWQNKIIKFNDDELLKHLSLDKNYGVMGGGLKNLIIIDFDNIQLQNIIIPQLPRTFTVKTGRGMFHKYFFSDKSESFKIFDSDMNTLADVQGEGKQVVGAGSFHPNGNQYEIVDDYEISYIDYAEIQALLIPHDKKPKKEKITFERPRVELQDDFIDRLKDSCDMVDVLKSFGINTSKNPTECPFHSSKGGKCLGFNKDTAHCFHCDGSWNIFSFVKEMKNCDFKESLEYLANMTGLIDELEISRRKYFDKIKENSSSEKNELKIRFLEMLHEKKENDATEMMSDYILKNNYIYTIKNDEKTEVWIYRDGIYIPQGVSEIKIILRDILDKWYSQYNFGKVMRKIEVDTFIDADKFFLQKNINEIPVRNGLLNIFSRELKSFTPEKIFFNKLNVEYNSHKECPKIEQFLKDILTHEEDRLVFYEIGGFCLLKEYKYEKAFMFLGNGRNGKDKSLELFKRLFGIQNCCAVPLTSIVPDSFIMSEFFCKMINIAGEINNQDLKDSSAFKAMTGRSLLSAQRKFLTPINFVNYAKFVFACNELPMVYDNQKGFWDRWVLLEFPYTFVPKEEKEKDTNFYNSHIKIRDEGIIDKITTEDEFSGLLNKFLDGLDRLELNKNFSITKGSDEVKQLWIKKSNSFMAFCLDFIEDDYDGIILKKELRKKYIEYCKRHKLNPKNDFVIKKTLQEMFGASEDRTQQGEWQGKQVYVWTGIKWK